MGDAQRKLMRTIDKFLSADCASPSSASPIRQTFVQVCQTLNTWQGIMSPPSRPCGEHICCRNLRFKGSPEKLKQNSNPFFRRQQTSNDDLQSLKRPFRNLNRLANFDGGIDSHDFFRTYSRLKRDHNIFGQGCQAIPKVDDPSDSVRTFNGAMLFSINKFREQITGKHRFHEPDWPSSGHLAETQSRREALDVKLTPERGRGQVLSLRLRL